MGFYGFRCEYCEGTVQELILDREPINHPRGIVILENVPIGVCDRCGAHYYVAGVLKRAESLLASGTAPQRTVEIPVATF